MSYNPFCSIDISFGDMQTLKEAAKEKKKEDHSLRCLYGRRLGIDRYYRGTDRRKKNAVWIDECKANPTPAEVVKSS